MRAMKKPHRLRWGSLLELYFNTQITVLPWSSTEFPVLYLQITSSDMENNMIIDDYEISLGLSRVTSSDEREINEYQFEVSNSHSMKIHRSILRKGLNSRRREPKRPIN
jgi:hypothetical protein